MKTAAFLAAGLCAKAQVFDSTYSEMATYTEMEGRNLMEEMDGDMKMDMENMKMDKKMMKKKMKMMKKAARKMKKMMRKFKKVIRKTCKKNKVPKMKCKMVTKWFTTMATMKHMMDKKMMMLWMHMGGKYNEMKLNEAKDMYMKEMGPFYEAAMKFGCKAMQKMGKKFCKSFKDDDKRDNCNEYRMAKGKKCVPWMRSAMMHEGEMMGCKMHAMWVAKGYMKGMRKMMGLPKDMNAKSVGMCVTDNLMKLKATIKKHEMEFAEELEEAGIEAISTKRMMKWMMGEAMKAMGMDKDMMKMKDKM